MFAVRILLLIAWSLTILLDPISAQENSQQEIAKSDSYLKKLLLKAQKTNYPDSIVFYSQKALDYSTNNNLNTADALLSLGYGHLINGNHVVDLVNISRATT